MKEKRDIVFEASQDAGLLECLRIQLSNLPSGRVKSYLEHRMVSVDGVVTTKFDYPVKSGQTVKIRMSGGSYDSPLEVLYEDDDLLAVNKPAGLLSVATDTEKEKTAFRILRDSGISPLYVVHRLDRDTSGVLLFARSQQVREQMQQRWGETTLREYLAICQGVFEKKRGRRETMLTENSAHVVYSSPSDEGKLAVTNYEVLKENRLYSYLRVTIETGRKNQIRVHLSEMGHPVVGDRKYGAVGSPLGRLGLHASALELPHPKTGQPLLIRAKHDRRFKLPEPK